MEPLTKAETGLRVDLLRERIGDDYERKAPVGEVDCIVAPVSRNGYLHS